MKKVTVVLPVYNEAKCLAHTFDAISTFSKKHPQYDFIFVDDGSTDNSLEVLRNKIKKISPKKISVISYTPNQGKGYAIKKGITHASGDFVCFTDSDLAYSLDHLHLLTEKLTDFDLVIGRRGLVKDNVDNVKLIRKILGAGFNFLSRKIVGLEFEDMQAGIKGFRKATAEKLFRNQSINGWAFDVELIYLANKYGYSIGEIPARLSKNNPTSDSKVSLFKDTLKMFFSLLKIRLANTNNQYE